MFWWEEEEEEEEEEKGVEEKGVEEEKVDRISVLPLEIKHRIVSFLTLRKAIQTCILSKDWRYVWKSLPYLNFRVTSYGSSKEIKFSDFVDKLLNVRDNFEELHVNILSRDIKNQLPLGTIFTSKYLKRLELHYKNGYSDFPKLDIPNSISLPSLEKLTLGRFRLDEDDDIKKILLNCHVLESLSFDSCIFNQTNLEISSPNLKHLKMSSCQYIVPEDNPEDDYIVPEDDPEDDYIVPEDDHEEPRKDDPEEPPKDDSAYYQQTCTININAPNLLSFECHYPTFYTYYSCDSKIQRSLEFKSLICESLETFKLETYGDLKVCVQDGSKYLPKLKKLVLIGLEGATDALNSMFSSCLLLESLSLKNCEFGDNILDIFGLQLKHLEIYEGAVESIKLYAPNLLSLHFHSLKWKYFDTGSLSTLVSANIDLSFAEEDTYSWEKPKINDQMRKLYLPQIVKLLRAFRNAEDLTLSPLVIMLLSEAPSLLENLLEFSNLTRLDLSTWLLRDSINVISHLLEISPDIESLIMRTNVGNDKGLKPIKVSLQRCNFHHLKEVEIYGPSFFKHIKGYDNLTFLTILLKKANNLRKVTLNLSTDKELTEAARFAENFPRVSPFVTFLFFKVCPSNWS